MNQEIFPLQNPDEIVFVTPVHDRLGLVVGLQTFTRRELLARNEAIMQQRQDEEDEAIQVSPVIRRRRTTRVNPPTPIHLDEGLDIRTVLQSRMN